MKYVKSKAQDWLTTILLVAIVVAVALRMIFLIFTPPGFFLDEAATGAHVVAMLHHWTNAHGQSWPLFSDSLGGGYTTPVYLYPLVAWAAVFGTSELALRYFSEVATIIAIFVLAYALNMWINKRSALVAALVGLVLPWSWLQGSIAWDPALVPLLVALAFASFSCLYLGPLSGKRHIANTVVFPLALLGLAYLYPPARVTAPLLFIAGYALLWRVGRTNFRTIIITCVASFIIVVPLIQFMIQPAALGRSQALSVFHDTSILAGLWHLFLNFFMLLNPVFLFITGDPNLRHSTGYEGMLGAAAVIPLAVAIVAIVMTRRNVMKGSVLNKNQHTLLLISLYGIATSFVGSALTNEGQPHSLRATASWIFIVILITVGWQVIHVSRRRYLQPIALAVAIIGTLSYATDLALLYPSRAAASFDVPQREKIESGESTPGYPGLARQYYEQR